MADAEGAAAQADDRASAAEAALEQLRAKVQRQAAQLKVRGVST